MRRGAIVGLLLIGAWGATPARAEERDSTVPVVRAAIVDDEDGEGTTFQVEGRAPKFPDGTTLHVALTVKNTTPPVELCLFRVQVQREAFAGSHRWDDRTFAPGEYEARVDLWVGEQPMPIRKFVVREFGWGEGHVETLDRNDIGHGTGVEQAKFARRTVEVMIALVRRIEAARGALAAACGSDPEWSTALPAATAELDAAKTEFDATFSRHVGWRDPGLISQINGLQFDVRGAAEERGRRRPRAQQRLNGLAVVSQRMLNELEARLPIAPLDPEKERSEEEGR